MNKQITLLIVLILSFNICTAFSQENEPVLKAPSNWKSEVIPFPLGFAREIDFVGYEDIRFAPQWSDQKNQQFWMYSFAWYVDMGPAMTESKLTEIFNRYYDGLMGVDDSIKSSDLKVVKLDKTISKFIKTADGFKGTMRVYDRFFSKSYITLKIKVKETFCTKMNKRIILNDISAQHFDHEVWKEFNDVNISIKCN